MRMAKFWNIFTSKCFQGHGATGVIILLVRKQNDAATLEDTLVVSSKINIFLPSDSAVMLLGSFLKKLKIYVHT